MHGHNLPVHEIQITKIHCFVRQMLSKALKLNCACNYYFHLCPVYISWLYRTDRHFSNSLINCAEWWSLIKEKNMSQKLLGPKRCCLCVVNLMGEKTKQQITNQTEKIQALDPTSEYKQNHPNKFHFIYLEHYMRMHRAVTQTSMFYIRYLRKISNISNQC